jgi:hypothetical protein
MALGHAFGIEPSVALGLSLLRRGREIIIGIPVLLAWQIMEMRNLRIAGRTGEAASTVASPTMEDKGIG